MSCFYCMESEHKSNHEQDNQALRLLADAVTPDVPDASSWSVNDVARYIKSEGFPTEARKFREDVRMSEYM